MSRFDLLSTGSSESRSYKIRLQNYEEASFVVWTRAACCCFSYARGLSRAISELSDVATGTDAIFRTVEAMTYRWPFSCELSGIFVNDRWDVDRCCGDYEF